MDGIARIRLGAEAQWQWINYNLLGPDLLKSEAVVPQIAVDPVNGEWAHTGGTSLPARRARSHTAAPPSSGRAGVQDQAAGSV